MDYIQNAYKMPFLQRGAEVEYRGRRGVIAGARGPYLLVDFAGKIEPVPPDMADGYFIDGEPIKDYKPV